MAKILIKNGKVWDGEKFSLTDILTDGNIVSKIEKNMPAAILNDHGLYI